MILKCRIIQSCGGFVEKYAETFFKLKKTGNEMLPVFMMMIYSPTLL